MKLYDYVFNIINKKRRFSDLNTTEQSGFNAFMVNKVISMDYDLLPLADENNSILNLVPDDVLHDSLQEYIPYKKYDVKYKKATAKKSENKDKKIKLISDYYEVPIRDAEMYFNWLSDSEINHILEEYGVN